MQAEQISWEYLIGQIDDLDVADDTKAFLREKWIYLAKILRDKWLHKDRNLREHPWLSKGKQEPYESWKLADPDLRVKVLFAVLADRAKCISSMNHSSAVTRKIELPESCWAGFAEINGGWKLYNSGIRFEYVKEKGYQGNHDIRAYVGPNVVSVEVKSFLYSGKELSREREILDLINAQEQNLYCRGTIQRPLDSPRQAEAIKERIRSAINKALAENSIVETGDSEWFWFCMGPRHMKQEIDDRSVGRLHPLVIRSTAFHDSNFNSRVIHYIDFKVRQLDVDCPGILYFQDVPFRVGASRWPSTDLVEKDILEAIGQYRDLLFVAMSNTYGTYGEPLNDMNGGTIEQGVLQSRRLYCGAVAEQSLVVINPFCRHSMSSLGALVRAFP